MRSPALSFQRGQESVAAAAPRSAHNELLPGKALDFRRCDGQTTTKQLHLSTATGTRFPLSWRGSGCSFHCIPRCGFWAARPCPAPARSRAGQAASASAAWSRIGQKFSKTRAADWEAVINSDSVLLCSIFSLKCLQPNASAEHFSLKFKRGDVNTGRKRPACLQLVGVVILPSKVTFPVSMNYSYILVRDTVWGIYGAFNSAIIDLLD